MTDQQKHKLFIHEGLYSGPLKTKVKTVSGRTLYINRFTLNLALACGGESFVQADNGAWIRAKNVFRV